MVQANQVTVYSNTLKVSSLQLKAELKCELSNSLEKVTMTCRDLFLKHLGTDEQLHSFAWLACIDLGGPVVNYVGEICRQVDRQLE